jgi:succinate-semialdehyde dehydrogenase/glutarate-semialdehyde dehydrogenase
MAVVEQAGTGADGRRRLRISNPATLEPVGEIEVQTAADVSAAIERARKAQPEWAELGFEARARYLRRAVEILIEKQAEFVDVVVAETGKPRLEAFAAEIVTCCDALQFYAKRAGRILADRTIPLHLLKTKKLKLAYRPLGVVGIITPWNFPFVLSLNPTAQALIAGNAVVLKPSEVTPFSGRLVETLLREAGLPEGVFSLVVGDGETGAALVEGGVDKISFTGSVRTGRVVAEACGRNLVPFTLELGGKDPMIVCADADLERAARGAVWGAFANAGQVCTSTERVYVVEDVADEFTARVLDHTAGLRQGCEGEFDIGSVIWPQQLEVIETHMEDARAKGAKVLAGGRRNPDLPGHFYEPTVLADVDHDMAIMREETFGPILPIMRVEDEETALRLANDSRYGLNANVWTRDKRKGTELAKAIESGSAVVNDTMITYAVTEAPFGGVKDSGIGKVNGELGLKSYCRVQSILVHRFGGKSEPLWYPYSAGKLKLLQRLLRFIWGSSLGRLFS